MTDSIEKRGILPDEGMTWIAYPAVERPWAALGAFGVVLAVASSIYLSFDSVSWSLISVVVLVFSLNRFFLPSRFSISSKGISARYPLRHQHYAWNKIQRFRHDQRGGYVSARHRPSILDAYLGMTIFFGKHRETVVELIQRNIQKE